MKISIITITYNSVKTIEQTIQSILNQNYKDLEYIIVDGCSTDGTMNIVNKYRNKISKIISEKDNGISDAFNKGIAIATGKVIGIINADDILYYKTLNVIDKFFNQDSYLDVLYGNVIRFVDRINDGYEVKADSDLKKMNYAFLLLHPAIFVRKSAYEKFGMYSCEYKNAMDYDLIGRMYYAGANFQYIDKPLSCFREGGVSENKFKKTMQEHKRIANQFGGSRYNINRYIWKLYCRHFVVIILKKTHTEKVFRCLIKHQKYKWAEYED